MTVRTASHLLVPQSPFLIPQSSYLIPHSTVLSPQSSVFIAFETKISSKIEKIITSHWPAGHNLCRPAAYYTGNYTAVIQHSTVMEGLDLCLKYGPRAPWSQFYMSLGRLYVPREVDLADKTRGAHPRSTCYVSYVS